ncbi:cytochrome oxidase putative small subunit CydP [Solimonas flava]|uniref:cytochrome oxidase putative small subunit CydP n=1 Tax=Solimonas flava TaxID=415849 RepID=UPI00040E22BF|nr:cytochrome oxidase putative small subunit CydP [Solimonas flava]
MPDRRLDDKRLLRHIIVIVVLKLVAIVALWSLFVNHQRVTVDSDRAGETLLGSEPVVAPSSPSSIRP